MRVSSFLVFGFATICIACGGGSQSSSNVQSKAEQTTPSINSSLPPSTLNPSLATTQMATSLKTNYEFCIKQPNGSYFGCILRVANNDQVTFYAENDQVYGLRLDPEVISSGINLTSVSREVYLSLKSNGALISTVEIRQESNGSPDSGEFDGCTLACVAGTVGGALAGAAGGMSGGPIGIGIGSAGGALGGAAGGGCFTCDFSSLPIPKIDGSGTQIGGDEHATGTSTGSEGPSGAKDSTSYSIPAHSLPIPEGFFKFDREDGIFWSNGKEAYCWVSQMKYVTGPVRHYWIDIHLATSFRRDGKCAGEE